MHRSYFAGMCIQLLKRPPCAVVIGERLVQQNEVDIVELQFAQRFQNGLSAFLIAVMLDPHFGGDKQLI